MPFDGHLPEQIRVVETRVVPIAREKEWAPMPEILHITPRARWEEAVAPGEYRGDTLATEGFIHCSTQGQLSWVAETFYRDQTGLVVLRIDPEKLKPPLRWESPPDSDERFPHVYGPLNLDAVVQVVPLEDALSRRAGD